MNESIDGLLKQVSQMKGQTSPRLRKLSVSKMFNQLMSRTSGCGGLTNSTTSLSLNGSKSSTSSNSCSNANTSNNMSGSNHNSGTQNNNANNTSIDKLMIPRMSFRDRARKKAYIRTSS